MTAKGKDRKEAYQWEAKRQWKGDPTEKDIEVVVKLYFNNKGKHDIDNFSKILYDALTGIVWEDDSQIKKATTEMLYDKLNPRITIEIL